MTVPEEKMSQVVRKRPGKHPMKVMGEHGVFGGKTDSR